MKFPFKERTISTVIVIPSAVIVLALAVLQYHWSARISEATSVRLADSLQMSMTNWQKDFFRYFSEIGLVLRIDPSEDAPGDINQYIRRFAEWRALAKYPKLVSNVYLLRPDGPAGSQSRRLNLAARSIQPEAWPPDFEPIRGDLATLGSRLIRGTTVAPFERSPETGVAPEQRIGAVLLDIGDPSMGWRFEPSIPALLHPVKSALLSFETERAGRQSIAWIAIELNRQEIQTRILPELAETYFQGTDGLDYQVAVVSSGKPGSVIYSSDSGFGEPEPADADGTIDIFAPADSRGRAPIHVFHTSPDSHVPASAIRISWFPLLRPRAQGPDWRLVVRHRRGGALGAFVLEMRRRDLAIGFGVLLVLVVNMGMLIATSHRAQRLAQLQMNFVTAVSHELRTPLTAIISGADNLSHGVVETKQQILQYGQVIGNQARQLFGLVEQILLFAVSRQRGLHYDLRPIEVQEVIDGALASVAGLIEAGKFTVERDVEEGLPRVVGDASALSQCLQNLITNALKYASEQRWMGIQAKTCAIPAGREVQINICDKGPGIDPSDLEHIFEPFYRSPTARAAQIRGTGLGLPLSKSIAEAMNGRLTVSSVPGGGSTFTLHLPLTVEHRSSAAL